MRIDASEQGIESVRKLTDRMTGPQMREAQVKAINDTAFKGRTAMVSGLTSAFDMPTPFIARSPKVVPATISNMVAVIIPTLDTRNIWSNAGKIGVDPQHVLQAQEFGGRRADKRSEVALRRAGILPRGYQTALPAKPFAGSDDGKGNIRGAFASQLISYFQAHSEQGFMGNMSARRKAQIHKGTKTASGRRYFVSYGGIRGGRTRHLAPGIWAAQGTGGVDVQPVLMFVRAPTYQPRISMEGIAQQAGLAAYLSTRMRFRIRQAMGV